METFPPEIERRIRRLRWTAGLIWLFWVLLAIPFYWLFHAMPHIFRTPLALLIATTVFGLGVVWFIAVIYRIGEVARSTNGGD